MNGYSSKINDLIEIGKKIKKIPNFFERNEIEGKTYEEMEEMLKKRNDRLNELKNQQKNLADELELDKNPNLEKLIDAESSIQELLGRPNRTYEDLSKLVQQRDFYRVQSGYENFNMKPLSTEEKKLSSILTNKNINSIVSIDEYNEEKNRRKEFLENYIKERKEKIKRNYNKPPTFSTSIPRDIEAEQKAIKEINKKISKPYIDKIKKNNKEEAQRRQNFLKERKERKEKEFYDNKWYDKDSFVDRYIKKRKKSKIENKIEKRNLKIQKDNAEKLKKETEIKKYKNVVDDYETNQEILKHDDYYKMYSPEKKEVQDFVNDPLNQLKYKEAQISLSEKANSRKSQRELSKIRSQREKLENQRYKEKLDKDKKFTKEYITTQKSNSELEEKLNNTNGPLTKEEYENLKPQILENKKNNEFLDKNKDKFEKINGNIKEEINNEIFEKETSKLFKEKQAEFKTNFYNDKSQLKDINKEIRTLKKKDINNKIRILNEHKENMPKEQFESLSSDYKGQLTKLEELKKKKEDIKSNLRESRINYLNSEDPKIYEKEINRLNKDLKTLENIDVFNDAQKKFDAGDMTKENLDALKNDLFGESEVVAPKRTRKEIEKEIKNNMKLVKKFGGNAEREIEEDIVDVFKNKLKNASKFNLMFSGINAISQYKDSRKDGHGVVGSAVRAGVDFALAETLGGFAYMGISLAKELPGAAIKGTEMLHTEVRKMNTSSRFSVFGQAQFQDTDQLATMRQSGMEMAKMANYRLEQTLMGNEARYLHK